MIYMEPLLQDWSADPGFKFQDAGGEVGRERPVRVPG